jgi:hypothetical protein
MRKQTSLAGSWQFKLDPEGTLRVQDVAPDQTIQVPMPWQAAFPELEKYSGFAWYQREIDLTEDWLTEHLLLTFGAVDYWCEVFVNGQRVGEHEGGYTRFSFDIRPYVQAGSNQIAVRVYDAAYPNMVVPRWYEDGAAPGNPPFNPLHVPHGKQSWYYECGGIWQDVTLTALPAVYVDQVQITTDIHSGTATVNVKLGGTPNSGATLQVAIDGIDGAAAELALRSGQQEVSLTVTVPEPTWWTPETPQLYTATVSLGDVTSGDQDAQNIRFGFRHIAINGGQLLLNGEPIYMLAALDQDMYHRTIYTVPSEEYLRDEFRKAKELGLNTLRCHIKPPDPLYMDLADEMGLLTWIEIPSWRTFYPRTQLQYARFNVTDDIKARARQTLEEMIARDFNHPSLIIWTIVNEDWGTSVNISPNDRAWLAEMYDYGKQLDTTRLVVDNSACIMNVHVKSDIDDYHVYTNIPGQEAFFDTFIENFSRRANWSYTGQGEAQRTGEEVLILSEFGNWGLPTLKALRESDGSVPEWFKLGPWWSAGEGEPGWPKDVESRFQKLGLSDIWKDFDTFAEASQWHQYTAMKYEIEAMRRQPQLMGYVITELSDIYWESNGLLDFNRGKKVYHDVFALINTPDVVLPRLPRYNTWDDQTLPFQVTGSHFSGSDWSQISLTTSANGDVSTIDIPALGRGEVANWGVQSLNFGEVNAPEVQSVQFAVSSGRDIVAQNDVKVLVLPAEHRTPHYTGSLTIDTPFDPFADLSSPKAPTPFGGVLQALGYPVTETFSPEALIVTTHPTDEALNEVRRGGRMLYIANGLGPFFWYQGRGGIYGGSWITSYTWVRDGIFKRVAISNPLSMPYAAVMPTGVFAGLPFEDPSVQQDFLSGQITGWIGHPAVNTVQFRYGEGIVLMTTFNFVGALSQPTADPVAVAMLHDLVEYVTSDACQPTLTTNYDGVRSQFDQVVGHVGG